MLHPLTRMLLRNQKNKKRKKLLICAMTWIELEGIMLSEKKLISEDDIHVLFHLYKIFL